MFIYTGGPGAKLLDLRLIEHGIGEISAVNLRIGEFALQQHAVIEPGLSQISSVKAAREGHHIPKVSAREVGILQLGGVEHRARGAGGECF